MRYISKSKLRHTFQRNSELQFNHKTLYPDSFLFKRGDHPYGAREYLLVRPVPRRTGVEATSMEQSNAISSNSSSSSSSSSSSDVPLLSTNAPMPSHLQILATLHANNNIVFGATVNMKVVQNSTVTSDSNVPLPTVTDLCPILLHAALDDCSGEGEQPQALSTLHGLCAWVRQCLEGTAQSPVIDTLKEQIKTQEESTDGILRTTGVAGRRIVTANAHVQLECITAIATGNPRPGHTVVGQDTHRVGIFGWEALSREFALLDYTEKSKKSGLQLSDECLLYRKYSENYELSEIELLADTSPPYLASAGGAMARFFLQ
jgi:hypothetical protein